jgi:cobalt-zinc-cadmium efflux system outer membrane protein
MTQTIARKLRLLCSCWLATLGAQGAFLSALPGPDGTLTYGTIYPLAEKQNLDVIAARARYATRRAEIRIAAQRPNPLLSSEVTREDPHAFFMLEFPIELGGRRARRIDVATASLKLADAELADALRRMRRELRRAFYGLIHQEQRIALAQMEVDLADRVVKIAGERYRAGAVAYLEVLQAQLSLTRARSGLSQEEKQKRAAVTDLKTVLNAGEATPLSVSGSLSDFPSAFDLPRYRQAALQQNPDLLLISQQTEVENQRLRLLRAESSPELSFVAGSVFSSADFSAGPRAGFTLELPIHKKREGQIEQSRAVMDQLRLAAQATERRLEGALQSAYARLQAQQSRMEVLRTEIIAAAAELQRLAEESYQEGKTSILTVLESQKSLRDVRLEALQAEFDFQMAVVDLEHAAGVPLP